MLLIGLLAERLFQKIKLPMITAFIVVGILMGPSLFNVISPTILDATGIVSQIALGMIAFSLGEIFLLSSFNKIGRHVIYISLVESILPWVLVTMALHLMLQVPFSVAILYGAVASATAPAAVLLVVREYRARGNLTDTLLGVVAIDDVWCLIIFALSLTLSGNMMFGSSPNNVAMSIAYPFIKEIVCAVILGCLSALLCNGISRFIRLKSDLLIFTLGFLFFTTGLALYFNLSLLLADITFGVVLINSNPPPFKIFDTVKEVDSPLYLLFFILAGANLDIGFLKGIGVVGITFVCVRSAGKFFGAWLGAYVSSAGYAIRRYLGWALLPQAGVALGLALIIKEQFPKAGSEIFSVIVATTIFYELIGPLFIRYALIAAKEVPLIKDETVSSSE
jgi:Kef-type K+ transport system membrane component KefB